MPDTAVRSLALYAPRDTATAVLTRELRAALGSGGPYPPNHYGLGVAGGATQQGCWITVVFVQRRVLLEPLPAAPQPGTLVAVRGTLVSGSGRAAVLFTTPAGEVLNATTTTGGRSFAADLPLLHGPGPYVLQVLLHAARGPQVAAQRTLWVGVPPPRGPTVAVVTPAPTLPRSEETLRAESLDLLNRARREHGLRPFLPHALLAQAAQAQSRDMAARGYFAHVSPGGDASSERLSAVGLRPLRWAENLALAPSVGQAHARWLASPAHRRNMLDPGLTHVGVGLTRASSGHLYITHVFARPRPAAGEPRSTR